MGENIRNYVHVRVFVAVVTVNLDATYYYVRNTCQMSKVMFSTCLEPSRNLDDFFYKADLISYTVVLWGNNYHIY